MFAVWVSVLAGCTDHSVLRQAQPSGFVAMDAPETSGTPGQTTPEGTDGTSGTGGTGGTGGGETSSGTTGGTTGGTSGTTGGTETGGTTTGGTSGAIQACYPGPTGGYDVCFDTVVLSPVPSAYAYPAPLGGDPQYAAPVRYLDLAVIDPTTSVAANFVLDEFAQEYKGEWGVVQVHAVASIQAVRDDVGALIVNSGYRNPDWNASIGGATWSRHMYGDAFDLDPVSVSLDTLADACLDNGASYIELYEAHVHCDWRDDPLDPAFYPASLTRQAPVPAELPIHAARVVEGADGAAWTAPADGWDEGEPLRVWTAYDADGLPIETVTTRAYTPPSGAAEVEVEVGGELRLRRPNP